MRNTLTFLALLTISCSCLNKKPSLEASTDTTDKAFVDLNETEKIGVFSEMGEEFKGDYRKYLGQNDDSTKVQLALNLDRRFAISIKAFLNESALRDSIISQFKNENVDSIQVFEFSTTSELKNLCVGRWTDEGKMIRLNFLLGQSEFFDSVKNEGVVEFIDDKTVLLNKEAKEVWISRALCKRIVSPGGSR
jgi:hypothetical protein